jgi:hypothetical protein
MICLVGGCVIIGDNDDDPVKATTNSSATGDSSSTSGNETDSAATGTTGASSGGATSSDGTAGTTTGVNSCGWGSTGVSDPAEGYVCGGDGVDPGGAVPLDCPADLRAGAACGDISGIGCCDADGNAWYCTDADVLYKESC